MADYTPILATGVTDHTGKLLLATLHGFGAPTFAGSPDVGIRTMFGIAIDDFSDWLAIAISIMFRHTVKQLSLRGAWSQPLSASAVVSVQGLPFTLRAGIERSRNIL